MKSCKLIIMISLLISVLFFQCKKSDDDNIDPAPVTIQDIIPQALIDSLRVKGLAINEGQTPPDIQGIFNQSPVVLTARANSSDYPIGKLFADYRFQFYEQNTNSNSIKINYKSLPNSDAARGQGAYVIGSEDLFTIFSENKGEDKGISYVSVTVISGEITVTGIRNMQLSFFIKSKGSDPGNTLLQVGEARILTDGNRFSEKVSNYRMAGSVMTLLAKPTLSSTDS